MSDLLVSIVESLAGAAAAAAERRRKADPVVARARAPAPAPIPPGTAAATSEKRSEPAVTPPLAAQPPPAARIDARQLLGGPEGMLRTIVAIEILGPPLALRRQNLWDGPSV